MASVKKVGGKYCVTHATTGAVLQRGGQRVCYATLRQAQDTARGQAQADANQTRCRVMGICPKLCPVQKKQQEGRGG